MVKKNDFHVSNGRGVPVISVGAWSEELKGQDQRAPPHAQRQPIFFPSLVGARRKKNTRHPKEEMTMPHPQQPNTTYFRTETLRKRKWPEAHSFKPKPRSRINDNTESYTKNVRKEFKHRYEAGVCSNRRFDTGDTITPCMPTSLEALSWVNMALVPFMSIYHLWYGWDRAGAKRLALACFSSPWVC